MKTKILLMTTLLMSSISFANIAEQARGHVNDIESFVDGLEESMTVSDPDSMPIDLGDYDAAKADIVQRIREASQDFKACVASIADTASGQMTAMNQEIASIRELAQRRNLTAIQQLLDDKIRAKENLQEDLSNSLTRTYQECVKNFLSLDSHIQLWIRSKVPAKTRAFRALHAFLVLSPTIETVIGSSPYYRNVIHSFLGESEYSRDRKTSRYILRKNKNNIYRMFALCTGPACRYLLASEYASWIVRAVDINKDLEIVEGVKLKAVDLPYNKRRYKRKVRYHMNQMVR